MNNKNVGSSTKLKYITRAILNHLSKAVEDPVNTYFLSSIICQALIFFYIINI